ncbi:MAG: methylenetetrahydrofolate reductase [Chloroflexi bacterium]|nr:methylenetetrahydrofolate reductase [Chloroflexota bacterium]
MSRLAEQLAAGKFVVSAEVQPPKGVDLGQALEEAQHLKGHVVAVNVTDQQSSVMRLGSLALSHRLTDLGIEPIFQVTCRDRNRIALQSDLLSAYALGIENVLCLTGDYVSLGDHPQAKPVFDLDSITLLQVAKTLEGGKDMVGKDLKGKPKFFLGAVVSPGSNPVELQIMKMEKKVKAGAQFFQTQAVYEPEAFEAFMKSVRHLNVPVLVGIIPLKSPGQARFMNKNIAGIHVPDNLILEMEQAKDRTQKGLEIAARLIKDMKGMCQGVHIMPLGWEKHLATLLQMAGLA